MHFSLSYYTTCYLSIYLTDNKEPLSFIFY